MPSTTCPGTDRGAQLDTEHALALTKTPEAGTDVYQNKETLWHPIWARGVYGGTLIAQSLMAAQQTTPPGFFAHSMHCLFVRPARMDSPVAYHVDRIRDGRSITTRSVHAQQAGEYIFSAQISFSREDHPPKTLHHQTALPSTAHALGPPTKPGEPIDPKRLARTCHADGGGLYECVQVPRDGSTEGRPESTKLLQWIRVRRVQPETVHGQDSSADDRVNSHLAALAYISDHYFIGTALRVNGGQRFTSSVTMREIIDTFDKTTAAGRKKIQLIKDLIQEEIDENAMVAAAKQSSTNTSPVTAEFMVSLDHSIYFHEPTAVFADDWMLIEAESPWSGHERGLVVERIWNTNGVLIATCMQEGVIRVQQDLLGSKL